jgi:Ca2+/Na+ antiporter
MDIHLSTVEITLIVAAVVVGVGYLFLILYPAWRCYGRLWEKVAAAFLTLFILATMLGVGTGIGLAIVWTYDTYA